MRRTGRRRRWRWRCEQCPVCLSVRMALAVGSCWIDAWPLAAPACGGAGLGQSAVWCVWSGVWRQRCVVRRVDGGRGVEAIARGIVEPRESTAASQGGRWEQRRVRRREGVSGRRPRDARLLTTINKQESVMLMVDTRIFTIYQIVILEYWRQLITS